MVVISTFKMKNMMLKKIVMVLMLVASTSLTFGQKFAYVDTEYILKNIPEYKEAQEELDKLSIEWQKQLERRYAEIDKMYKMMSFHLASRTLLS